jgi:hypothetical protein
MVEPVMARRWQLEARSWAARGGRTRWDSAAVWPGSTDVGWEREQTDEAHALVRGGEREDAKVGKRESKRKTYSVEYIKGARGPSGPMKGTVACGRGRPAR